MSVKEPGPLPDELRQREAAVAELRALALSDRRFASLEINEVLKLGEAAVVLRARLDGRQVVLKRYRGPGAAGIAAEAAVELALMDRAMGRGPLRVNRCLLSVPDQGLVVLTFARHRALSQLIYEAGPDRRARLIRQGGDWLRAYTVARRRTTEFGPGFWVEKLAVQSLANCTAKVRDRAERLRQVLARRNLAHAGRSVVHAATHGDFVPENLLFWRGTMTGIDIQGENWQAVARDAARFLVGLRRPFADKTDETIYGIERVDWDAFHASGVIADAEIHTALPFFIGAMLHDRLLKNADDPDYVDRVCGRIDHYLSAPIVP